MPGPFYFAWCGGAIQEQLTLVTNGNTHGGLPLTATIVGDTVTQQIQNLASSQDLEEGALYKIEGPNIRDGTYFIYDTSPLQGQPFSINLTQAATANVASANFNITKPVDIGGVAGTLSHGSNVVVLGVIDLPAGTYGIRGTGIGETNLPIGVTTGTTTIIGSLGQPVIIVSSAFFVYDGVSGTAQMKIMAATPHTVTGFDPFGQPTNIITYTVSEQDVRATTSGQFSLLITGMPDTDWFSITGIPAGVLSGLTTGLRYNISGTGLQVGTTFLAPGSGTAIEIDQPATSSQLNAILTITGPRTPDTAFDPAVHNRFDEEILSIEIAQEEGGFATLNVRLRLTNPQIGLLAIGRNLWCWLSWDQAWTADGSSTPDLVPLFNGRLVGVPRLQAAEVVQLEFLARPDDFTAQKTALVAALQVLPYWDPVWLAANVNPDTVLETYSALWHIDRVSLGVSISDILQGEDGTLEIGEDVAFYGNFSLAYSQPPLVAVTVSGTVSWTQEADGFLDVTGKIVDAFHHSGSPFGDTFPSTGVIASFRGFGGAGAGSIGTFAALQTASGGGGLISCLCGDGLKSEWPKAGTSIGGGWSLATNNDSAGIPLCYIIDANRPNGWFQPTFYNVSLAGTAPPASQAGNTQDQSNVNTYLNPVSQFGIGFPLNIYKVRMTLFYQAARRRTESITAVMTADVQRLLSDSSESDREAIELTSEYVGQGVDAGGGVPIGKLAYRSYFQTDRGARSFEYLMLAARAKLRARARAVDITFAVDWRTALQINLRNSVTLFDRRLPGGAATGKVKSYRLTMADGRMMGEFTIGCSIGAGNASTAAVGINSYVEDGYTDDYQVVAGGQVALLADELAYETLDDFAIDDDGLDLTNVTADSAVNECVVTNGLLTQVQTLSPFQHQVMPTFGDPLSAMRTLTTTVTLDLKPVQGSEFHTSFFPAISQLALPKTIDLGALVEVLADWDSGASTWDDGASIWDEPG